MKDYSVKIIELCNDKLEKEIFQLETFMESKKLEEIKILLLKNIDNIIEKHWGKFSKEFIIHHILRAKKLKLVRKNNEIVALAAASKYKINNIDILYLEFTVVDSKFQGYNLSTRLNASMIIDEFISGKFKPINVITLTRNMRVLGALSKFSSYIYPDPDEFKKNGKLKPASDETWGIAQEILKQSWNPERKLQREGCVIIGSYENTPWLIIPKIQKHHKQSIRELGEKYLEYKKNSDKEFIVHVKYNIFAVIKYIFWILGLKSKSNKHKT